jgi:exosortase/archaeosortase family protein
MRTVAVLTIQLLAFWPVWRWYAARIGNSSDELWGLLALATAILVLLQKRSDNKAGKTGDLILSSCFILLYTVTYTFFPPLLRGAIAVTAIGCAISSIRFGKRFHPGITGLLLLSLPVIPTLQFYLGYPLRVLVGALSALLIQFSGFAVVREGTCLNWSGTLVWIDAPCSGIRMLWTGLYLTFTLICLFEFNFKKASIATMISLVAIILGNVFRSVALFYIEAKIVLFPPWAHEGVGVVIFIFTAIFIVWSLQSIRNRGRMSCEPSPSM